MKRGTVFKNPYTPSNPTYFIYNRTLPRRGIEPQKAQGYGFTLVDGKWKMRKAEYYLHSLKEFKVVGEIDSPEEIIAKALFTEIVPFVEEWENDI